MLKYDRKISISFFVTICFVSSLNSGLLSYFWAYKDEEKLAKVEDELALTPNPELCAFAVKLSEKINDQILMFRDSNNHEKYVAMVLTLEPLIGQLIDVLKQTSNTSFEGLDIKYSPYKAISQLEELHKVLVKIKNALPNNEFILKIHSKDMVRQGYPGLLAPTSQNNYSALIESLPGIILSGGGLWLVYLIYSLFKDSAREDYNNARDEILRSFNARNKDWEEKEAFLRGLAEKLEGSLGTHVASLDEAKGVAASANKTALSIWERLGDLSKKVSDLRIAIPKSDPKKGPASSSGGIGSLFRKSSDVPRITTETPDSTLRHELGSGDGESSSGDGDDNAVSVSVESQDKVLVPNFGSPLKRSMSSESAPLSARTLATNASGVSVISSATGSSSKSGAPEPAASLPVPDSPSDHRPIPIGKSGGDTTRPRSGSSVSATGKFVPPGGGRERSGSGVSQVPTLKPIETSPAKKGVVASTIASVFSRGSKASSSDSQLTPKGKSVEGSSTGSAGANKKS